MIGHTLTDEELVEQIKDGDRESLDVLVRTYLPIVGSKVHRLVPEYDADDVTQEIFLSLVNSIEKFQGKSAFATWFHRIITNRVMDYYRRISYRQKEKHQNPRVSDPWKLMDSELTLREVLVRVPDKYREVLILRFMEGLSFGDIAERLGLTYEATRYRYRRAIRVARRKIDIN
jgi:RNA polymerase sigma-70 factor (ECF subfamily)